MAVPLNYLFPEAALRHAIVDSGATHIVTGADDAARLEALLVGEKVTLLTTGPEGGFDRALAAQRAVAATWCPAGTPTTR